MEDKDKKDKKEKTKKSLDEDNSALCWPHYHVYEDEFIPSTEEQAKMSEKEFREWVKSQGYYV